MKVFDSTVEIVNLNSLFLWPALALKSTEWNAFKENESKQLCSVQHRHYTS